MFEFDNNQRKITKKEIIGIDEAGRGPWAGPLVVCGVSFDQEFNHFEINDSKLLSFSKRQELFKIIKKTAKVLEIEIISSKEIDKIGVHLATKKAIEKITTKYQNYFCIIDFIKVNNKNTLSLVKADQKSLAVAAASIVAKQTRDLIMKDWDKKYPQYGFKTNVGYGTKQHKDAIKKFGVLPIHRQSFKPIKNLKKN